MLLGPEFGLRLQLLLQVRLLRLSWLHLLLRLLVLRLGLAVVSETPGVVPGPVQQQEGALPVRQGQPAQRG
jgi:hypothetical protein